MREYLCWYHLHAGDPKGAQRRCRITVAHLRFGASMRIAQAVADVAIPGTTASLEDMLQLIPRMPLDFNGDCAQANGLVLPVVAINLAHRTDRWEALTARLADVGVTKVVRAPAVEGARLTDDRVAALLDCRSNGIDEAPRSHTSLTRPAIGCTLSHLGIWKWVIASNLPRVLVLEDDAAPASGCGPLDVCRVIEAIPESTGLVFVGRIIMGGLAERHDGAVLARLYYFNGTFAYLITPGACRSLLLQLLPLTAHIDHQISGVLIAQRRVLSAYYTDPHLFEPDWSMRSDIYVPLADNPTADRELGDIIHSTRRLLLDEGRPLLLTR